MNVLAHRMLEQGLIDATAARGVSDLLAQGESPARAFAACGLAEERVLQFLSAELDLPYVELEQRSFSKQFLARFPARLILDRHVLPADDGNGGLLAVTADPFDTSAVDELRLATGKDFQLALAPLADIDRCIKRYLGVGADTVQSMISEAGENGLQVIDTDADEDMDLTEAAEGASIIRFVNQILTEAIELRATDVHIEPFEETLRVRYRIDGVLQEASVAEDPEQAGYRREAHAAGRADQDSHRRARDRRACVGDPHALRRGGRAAFARPFVGAPGTRQAGHVGSRSGYHPGHSGTAARHHPRDRTDRKRQNHHALRRPLAYQRHSAQDYYHRRSHRVPASRHQSDSGFAQGRLDLRQRAALDPASRPRRRSRR